MSKSSAPQQRRLVYAVLIAAVILSVLGVAAWTVTASTALSLEDAAIPTLIPRSFAFAEIAKPTYTAVPTQTPTSLPIPSPAGGEILPDASPTPESLVSAEIVTNNYSLPAGQEPPASPSYNGNKYILVDISEQHMYVYEGDVMVYSFVASTGMNGATRVGTFSVLDKIPNAYGATWNIWMPNWLGIYYAGSLENGIHALPILSNGATLWEGYLGTPISFGCVVLGTYESQLLYDWADVGIPVEIQR